MREPEFDDYDVLLMTTWLLLEADSPNGYSMSEATSVMADPANPAGTYLFKAGLPHVDYRRKAIEDAQEGYREKHGKNMPNGLVWTVEKLER